MSVDGFELILVLAVFLGAIVQGFSGFAFSAVAGAILLQVQAPGLAIPLLMICSLLIQSYVLVRLRATLSLNGSLPYLIGGAIVILAGLLIGLISLAAAQLLTGYDFRPTRAARSHEGLPDELEERRKLR